MAFQENVPESFAKQQFLPLVWIARKPLQVSRGCTRVFAGEPEASLPGANCIRLRELSPANSPLLWTIFVGSDYPAREFYPDLAVAPVGAIECFQQPGLEPSHT